MKPCGMKNTMIVVEAPVQKRTGKATKTDEWKNVFGDGVKIPAAWEMKRTRFGTMLDSTGDDRIFALSTANVFVRRCTGITSVCRVRRVDAGEWWYIVGEPETRGGETIFTVQKRAATL